MNQAKIRKIFYFSFVAVGLFACQHRPDYSSLHIENMKCEYQVNPLGLDIISPRLSWQLSNGNIRGEKQSAYRIVVATSSEKLQRGKADLWDTDKINSDQSQQVEYKGKPLPSRAQCFWKVMSWDKEGNPSQWSEPAFWSMGLLEKEDWIAQWIGSPDTVTAPYFRRSFQLKNVPERASVYLAALGYFELYVNGKKVGTDVLAPAVSNFSKRTYYKTYDVAKYLQEGTNSIGIWMGTGWYSQGLPGVSHFSPVVRAQLEIPGKQAIKTDSSWETKASERSLIGEWRWGKFGGELVDARIADHEWWNPVNSKTGWEPVVHAAIADLPCTAQKCGNNIRHAEIAPISFEQIDDSTIVADFGTNLTGMLKMKFHNLTAGQKITIHYADLDGRDPKESWRLSMARKGFSTYNQRDEFISAGRENEEFVNVFNYHGYRYALIEGLKYVPDKEDLMAIPIETEVPEAGSFTCSNDLYNRIHQMVRWTYRSLNLGGQTVDCPHRERVGYGDGQTIMDVGCYNFDASTLYTKWSENWWDEQTEDGFVPFVAPTPHKTGGGPGWGAMSIMVPWKTFLFYNDTLLLENGYPYMKKYIDYLGEHCINGVLQDIFPGEKWSNLGDWVPPRRGMDKSEWVDDDSRRFFNNCYRAHLLQTMIKAARVLHKNDDVESFAHELKITQKAIHEKWFNPDDNTYANGEQPYLIFPLQTGITPENLKKDVFEKYVQTLMEKDEGHLNTGMIGTQIMFDYLLENNRDDLIDIMVNQKTYPGWGYMIEKGATTCWEQWNGYYSQIHSCFPYIGGWFYRGLAGIQWDPESPGFKNIILRPAIVNSVNWVKCSFESPYGKIDSNWEIEDSQFQWSVTIPANTSATVYVPGQNLRLDGIDASGIKDLKILRLEKDLTVIQIESGDYLFTCEL